MLEEIHSPRPALVKFFPTCIACCVVEDSGVSLELRFLILSRCFLAPSSFSSLWWSVDAVHSLWRSHLGTRRQLWACWVLFGYWWSTKHWAPCKGDVLAKHIRGLNKCVCQGDMWAAAGNKQLCLKGAGQDMAKQTLSVMSCWFFIWDKENNFLLFILNELLLKLWSQQIFSVLFSLFVSRQMKMISLIQN